MLKIILLGFIGIAAVFGARQAMANVVYYDVGQTVSVGYYSAWIAYLLTRSGGPSWPGFSLEPMQGASAHTGPVIPPQRQRRNY
jgi:hypothetical protein